MCKYLIILLIVSSFFNNSYSQTTAQLDQKNGFKEFKLGDAKSKWVSQLGRPNARLANTFDYAGECCREAFGFPLQNIGLSFSQANKLSTIYLQYGAQPLEQFRSILGSMNSAFGKASAFDSNDRTGDVKAQWFGDKVTLVTLAIYKGDGKWDMVIMLFDKATTDPANDF